MPISKELAKMAFQHYPIYFMLKKAKKIEKISWYADVEKVNRLPAAYQYFIEQKHFDSNFFNQKLLNFYDQPKHQSNP